jgi:hypothetical protein
LRVSVTRSEDFFFFFFFNDFGSACCHAHSEPDCVPVKGLRVRV